MSVTIKTQQMGRFIDGWVYLPLIAALIIIAAYVSSFFVERMIVSGAVQVTEGQPIEFKQIELRPQALGALRIEAKAQIPANRWVTYEIDILDAQSQVIASAIKQAWQESGTWQEEGESGTWQEEDLHSGLDVRTLQSEPVKLVLDVLEYTTNAGAEINEPVNFQVKVIQGAVDRRFLWAGFWGSLGISFLSLISGNIAGKRVIKKTNNDSEVGDRTTLGGKDNLIKVCIQVDADETTPRYLELCLSINNAEGDQVYSQRYSVSANYTKENSSIKSANVAQIAYFIIDQRSSYGFFVEVIPDGSVDKTTLIVQEKVKTLTSVKVDQILTY